MANFLGTVFTKLFGNKYQKDVKKLLPILEEIKEVYPTLKALNHDDLRKKTRDIKAKISEYLEDVDQEIEHEKERIKDDKIDINEKSQILEDLDTLEKKRNKHLETILLEVLPEAFSIVKETARRFKEFESLEVKAQDFDYNFSNTKSYVQIKGEHAVWETTWYVAAHPTKWDMLHYDVQLIGGIVLHEGKIAEMATGEGKTLVATLPAFLNALAQRGVHIITVNDYLAKRDAEWMAPLMEFHGITVDCLDKYEPQTPERKKAYLADITYGTNNEFGFDYLRDNMSRTSEDIVQRPPHFAMVDEVDSVLVDDARTPLIISGPMVDSNIEQFKILKPKVDKLVREQKKLVTKLLNDSKNLFRQGNKSEGGLALLRAFRGFPKYRPLIKFLSEQGMKQNMEKVEGEYLAQNAKRMPEVDNILYFTIEEKNNLIELTDKGLELITREEQDESFFIIPDISAELSIIEGNLNLSDEERNDQSNKVITDFTVKSDRIHTIQQLLKAYTLFEKDVDYIIDEQKIKIVDEQTGRIMDGRRYSDGLHQALEAKENVKIEQASQTYATITLQNYFRMYAKLAGMTGTAETEAGEFWQIYKLDVVVIPTNEPIVRKDGNDKIFKTVREKYNAVVEEIETLIKANRPVLVGTTSVANSEIISRMLTRKKVNHQVLNAKLHQKEAEVVAFAGQTKTVTIATNMAGRGTDIKLSQESKEAGGLAIVGTERHESRRVDRQLRGRSGRQGDTGSSCFYVSLEDDLMRMFASGRLANIMDRLGLKEGEVIEHRFITNAIEKAQRKVEENNFAIRKRLLEYDDVMNMQRKIIYDYRHHALLGEYLKVDIYNSFYDIAVELVDKYDNSEFFKVYYRTLLSFEPKTITEINSDELKNQKEIIINKLFEEIKNHYQIHKINISRQVKNTISEIIKQNKIRFERFFLVLNARNGQNMAILIEVNKLENENYLYDIIEQQISLSLIDHNWKEHLRNMDDLKQESRNATFEQKDPLLVYKLEGFKMFSNLLNLIKGDITSFLLSNNFGISISRPNQKRDLKQETKAHKDQATPILTSRGENQTETPTSQKPRKTSRTKKPNDKVTVRYESGEMKKNIKYKIIRKDLEESKCVLVDE